MRGTGIYMRRLSTKLDGGPVVAAQRAADAGVRMIAIMGAWQEPGGSRVKTTAPNAGIADRYIAEFHRRGISAWLWGYPWGGAHEDFVRAMQSTAAPGGIAGWLLDPELGMKWAGGGRPPKLPLGLVDTMRQGEAIAASVSGTQAVRRAQAAALMDASISALAGRELAITSYGRAKFHANFPWKEFARRHNGRVIGSPQLYTALPREVDAGIAEWRAEGYELIVPSVGTFGLRSGAKLHEHLSTFVDGVEDVRGFWFWSWQQTDSQEWRIITRWSGWFERGIVAASASCAR